MKNKKLNREKFPPATRFNLIIGILTVVFLVASYFFVFLPFKQKTRTELTKSELEAEQLATIEVAREPERISARVIRVIDGDTLEIDLEGKTERLRLIGIDTPETVDPRKKIQCFGKEASRKAKELLQDQQIWLETDNTQGERDKYQRLLRFVYLEDGTLFNQLMIAEGYAHEYTYQNNPYRYQAEFKEAERQARINKKGLWGEMCNGNTTQPATQNVWLEELRKIQGGQLDYLKFLEIILEKSKFLTGKS